MLKNMSAAMAAGAVRRVLGLPSTWHRGMTFLPCPVIIRFDLLQLRLGHHLKEDQPTNDR